jgi:hypothetical protein
MNRHEEPHTDLAISLHRGLYLAIKMDPYEGHHTALLIALLNSLYLSIIMDRQ